MFQKYAYPLEKYAFFWNMRNVPKICINTRRRASLNRQCSRCSRECDPTWYSLGSHLREHREHWLLSEALCEYLCIFLEHFSWNMQDVRKVCICSKNMHMFQKYAYPLEKYAFFWNIRNVPKICIV